MNSREYVIKNLSLLLLPLFFYFCTLSIAAAASDQACSKWPEALKEAAKIRGIELKDKVPCVALNGEEFNKQFLTSEEKRVGLVYEEVVFKLLGLLSEDFDYQKCAAKNLGDNLLAYYDTKSKKIYINKDKGPQFDVLVHEAVHVLQDQSFNLEMLGRSASRVTDSALALSALVEGDAILAQDIYLEVDKENNFVPAKKLDSESSDCKFPKMYENLSLFPYTFGNLFCKREYQEGGFERLNSWFINPPKSTRQVIHVKRGPFNSKRVKIDKNAVQKISNINLQKKVYSDVFGQYFIRSLLGASVNKQQAIRAGTGWLGDRLELFKTDQSKFILAWKILWENEKHAQEFYQAFITHTSKHTGITQNLNVKPFTLSLANGRKYQVRLEFNEVMITVSS